MKILVIGGGFGGIVAAHSLRNELGDSHNIMLVSQSADFYLRAAFPRLSFDASVRAEDIRLPLQALGSRGVTFKQARVTAIRPDENRVDTTEGEEQYDYLIVALGTRYADESIPGLKEHSHSLWTIDAATRFRESIRSFDGGSFVTGAAPGSPCEGPTWELALQLDHLLRKKGARDKAQIHLLTTKRAALQPAGPEGVRWAKEAFGRLDIQVHTEAEVTEITSDRVILRDGREIHSHVSLIMAPYQGHEVVRQAGLGDQAGFIPVDPHMRSRSHRNIFAIGDAVSMPEKPKMAHNAMRGAKVATGNIASEIAGRKADIELEYEMMCVVENGGGVGTYMKSTVPWGGQLSIVMGARSDNSGLSPEEAHFIKKAFGDHFLSTAGNVQYIM